MNSSTSKRPEEKAFGERLLGSLGWQYGLTGATTILHVVVLAILSRLISKEDFGLLGMVLVFVGFAQLFSQFGVGHAVIQKDELRGSHLRVGFTLSVMFGFIMMAGFWPLAPFVAAFYREPELANVMRAISVIFVLEGFVTVAQSMMRRQLKFRALAIIGFISYLFGYSGVSVILALQGLGVWALVGGSLAQAVLRVVMLLTVQRHPKRPLLQIDHVRTLLSYGGGITLAALLNYGAGQSDYVIVGRFLGAGSLGLYTRAYQLMAMPATNFAVGLQAVIFPGMSRIKDDMPRLRRLYFTAISAVTFLSFPFIAIFLVLADEIVAVILGPDWLGVSVLLQILAFGTLFRTTYKIDHSLANALGFVYQRSVREGLYMSAVIIGSLGGVFLGQLHGVAWGVLLALFLNYVMAVSMSLRLLERSWSEFFQAQVPGLQVGILVATISLVTKYSIVDSSFASLITLLIAVVMSGLLTVGIVVLWPQFLGLYGLIALNRVLDAIPGHLSSNALVRHMTNRISVAEARILSRTA